MGIMYPKIMEQKQKQLAPRGRRYRSIGRPKRESLDFSQLRVFIQNSLRAIQETENPDNLNKIRRFFRNNVPLSLRSYFAAYLLKHGNFAKSQEHSQPKAQFKRLFLNVGKQHRITIKSMKELLNTVKTIKDNDIGNISIHRTFSFVDVHEAQVDTVISSLSSQKVYKDRKLMVTFAKKRNG